MRSMHEALEAAIAERGRCEKILRASGWAEGPVTIVGRGASAIAARAGAEALEWLLGWPARAVEAADFLSYSLPALRPRSILVAVSRDDEDETMAEITSRAGRQGARVLLLTANPDGPLAQSARTVLAFPAARAEYAYLTGPLIEHAALLLLAAEAARVFNPRNPQLEKLPFEALPDCLASAEIHLSDPIRSLALKLRGFRLKLTGGRFYCPAALAAVSVARQIAAPAVEALTLAEAQEFAPKALTSKDAFVFVSSSSSRTRKAVLALAARLKQAPAHLFALTSTADQELPSLCEFSLLAPDVPEIPGSLLSRILLERLMMERAGVKTEEDAD